MYMKEVLKFDVKQVHAYAAALRLCDVIALEKLLTYILFHFSFTCTVAIFVTIFASQCRASC